MVEGYFFIQFQRTYPHQSWSSILLLEIFQIRYSKMLKSTIGMLSHFVPPLIINNSSKRFKKGIDSNDEFIQHIMEPSIESIRAKEDWTGGISRMF